MYKDTVEVSPHIWKLLDFDWININDHASEA